MVSFRSLSFTAIVVLAILGCASAAPINPPPGSQSLTGGQGNPQLQAGQIGGLTRAPSQRLLKNLQPTSQVTPADRDRILADNDKILASNIKVLAEGSKRIALNKKRIAGLDQIIADNNKILAEEKQQLENPQRPRQ